MTQQTNATERDALIYVGYDKTTFERRVFNSREAAERSCVDVSEFTRTANASEASGPIEPVGFISHQQMKDLMDGFTAVAHPHAQGKFTLPIFLGPPAPSSDRAAVEGVSEAIRERDKLFCEAIIATMDSSGPRLVCDTEKLLHHFNVHRPDRSPELQPEYERARASNTNAADDVPRCPKCGYTNEDCAIHWDHHLCGEPTPPPPRTNAAAAPVGQAVEPAAYMHTFASEEDEDDVSFSVDGEFTMDEFGYVEKTKVALYTAPPTPRAAYRQPTIGDARNLLALFEENGSMLAALNSIGCVIAEDAAK